MRPSGRWVVDTNTLVSRLLVPGSVPALAVQRALELGHLLVSDETLEELAEVLARRKFDKYLTAGERVRFFELLSPVAIRIAITRPVAACRDAKDDKFLALAVNGSADAIVTGDTDLLALHPFLGIPILTPKDFLGREWNSLSG